MKQISETSASGGEFIVDHGRQVECGKGPKNVSAKFISAKRAKLYLTVLSPPQSHLYHID